MKRHAFTLVELLVAVAIIGLLIGLLLPAVHAAREASRRAQCLSNLHQFGVYVAQHTDACGRLPSIAELANRPWLQCPEHIAAHGVERIDSYQQRGQFQTRESIMEKHDAPSTRIVIVRDLKPLHTGQIRLGLLLDGHARATVDVDDSY